MSFRPPLARMMRQWRRVDLRFLLLAGMLVLAGALVIGQQRSARVASARLPIFPHWRLASGGSLPDRHIRFSQDRLAQNPRDALSWDMLAVGYMRKLRESGDPGYALRAEESLRRALALDRRDPQAPGLLAWVALVKHEFVDARQQAQALLRASPSEDTLYGILGDADIELGRYAEARQAFQRMMDIKPGAAAYTRAAYLRQLYGDVTGAIRMMLRAVEAASPRDRENLAWTRVQLGNLYFGRGDLPGAEAQYTEALRVYPGYLYGLAGLGGIRAAQGRFDDAIHLYEKSLAVIPLPVVAEALGDVYVRLGRQEEAERQFSLVEYIGRLTELNRIVYNRDLAYFYADHRRHLDQAVALAEREVTLRHDIYTDDTLAWADFQIGRYAEADRLMQQALALGTHDALLLYHAGMIARGLGDFPRAARYLEQALQTNPHFHILHAGEARHVLRDLRP
jgi:tetratricopeptide (TPR) repeat protein